MATRTGLIGSATSKENLQRLINQYLYSDSWIITDDNRLYNIAQNRFSDNYTIRYKSNRWRFEEA